MSSEDEKLGMDRRITRREFVDGVAVAVGGSLALPPLAAGAARGRGGAAPPQLPGGNPAGAVPYPPALTGLRGSHPGSFEAMHLLRDGDFWESAPPIEDTGQHYDLIVVGGGISGLTAAYTVRQARPGARVLLLENHDDFGGHAKRNELDAGSRTLLGYGGTQSIESAAPYSAVAKGLIEELGIDVDRWGQVYDRDFYRSWGLGSGFFFDRETFGEDRLVRQGDDGELSDEFLRAAPVSDAVRRDFARLRSEPFDPWPGEGSDAKKARLARIAYADFITDTWGLDAGILPLFGSATQDLFGVGIDAVPAQDAFGLGFPGFQGMGLDPTTAGPGQNLDTRPNDDPEEYVFHFPDGNASIARLLVRRLIPGSIPGTTMDDVVLARADYSMLDRPDSDVRLRLRSQVLRVRHRGAPDDPATKVEVTYYHQGVLRTVTADAAILACWHTVIPYICTELPERQRQAMAFAVKVPLVYTNVLLRDWKAFQKLGVDFIETPGLWHLHMSLDFPVSMGGYEHTHGPEEPVVVHLMNAPCRPGLPVRSQHRAGRVELLTTPFTDIERSIRQQMLRVLGPGGFDPAEGILAITVNRWPHGYAYQYNSLFDDFWRDGGEQPCEVARRPYGRLAIANSDSGAYAYTDCAIDHGHRAAQEILALETAG